MQKSLHNCLLELPGGPQGVFPESVTLFPSQILAFALLFWRKTSLNTLKYPRLYPWGIKLLV